MEREEVPMWLHAGEALRAARWGLIYEPVFNVQDEATLETNGPEPTRDQPKYPVQTQLLGPCQRRREVWTDKRTKETRGRKKKKKMETDWEKEAKRGEIVKGELIKGGGKEKERQKEQGIKGERVGGTGEWILSDWFQSTEHLFFISIFLFKKWSA